MDDLPNLNNSTPVPSAQDVPTDTAAAPLKTPETAMDSVGTPSPMPVQPPDVTPSVAPPIMPPASPPPVPESTPQSMPAATPVPTPPADMPKPKRSIFKLLAWILGIILLILAIGVGVIYADDAGLLNTGLSAMANKYVAISPLWGGLSSNPENAASQIVEATGKQTAFAYSGTVKLLNTSGISRSASSTGALNTWAGSTCDADPMISTASTFTLSTNKNDYDLSFEVDDQGLKLASAYRVVSGIAYFKPCQSPDSTTSAASTSSIVSTSNTATTSTTSTTSSTSSTTTSTAGINASSTWLKLNSAPTFTLSSVISQIGAKISSASFIGQEVIGDGSAYHFSIPVSGSDIAIFTALATDSPTRSWVKSNGPLDLWVSRKTLLPVKWQLQLTDAKKNSLTILATSTTASSKSIAVPDPVVDQTAAATPDQIRKTDIDAIGAALDKYFLAKGTYPVTTATVHTNQTDSVLAAALVPAYLDKLPTDANTAHYYGYSSNGTTYELSAVLEVSTDPQGTQSGPVTLYIVRGPKAASTTGQ